MIFMFFDRLLTDLDDPNKSKNKQI